MNDDETSHSDDIESTSVVTVSHEPNSDRSDSEIHSGILSGTSAALGPKDAVTVMSEIACHTDALFLRGKCVCDEVPCFHNASLLRVVRGRELPAIMAGLFESLEFVLTHVDDSAYGTLLSPDRLESLRRSVEGIVARSESARTILSSTPLGIKMFVRSRIESSNDYIQLDSLVGDLKQRLVNSVNDVHLRVGILFIQTLTAIDSITPVHSIDRIRFGGWEGDIARFGVNRPPTPPAVPNADKHLKMLIKRIGRVFDALSVGMRVRPLTGESEQIDLLGVELDRLEPGSRSWVEIRSHFCPLLPKVGFYLCWAPGVSQRVVARLTAQLAAACAVDSAERKLTLADQHFHSDTEDHWHNLLAPDEQVPLSITVSARNRIETIAASLPILEAGRRVHPFVFGVDVNYTDSIGVGQGPRRAWFDTMVSHYFQVVNPEDQHNVSEAEKLWEYTEDRSAIRPRQWTQLSDPVERSKLVDGFTACGRLIGLGLLHRIVPGIRLSPATLALLRGMEFDLDEVSRVEDEPFWRGVESLRSLNWADPATAEMVAVSTPDDEEAVTDENVGGFIKRRKYAKVVASIEDQVDTIRAGIFDVMPPGVLELLSANQLVEVLSGPITVTPAMVVRGIVFRAGHMNAWLAQILLEMNEIDLRRFLVFVSGSPLPPILPRGDTWMIFEVLPGAREDLLPTAATCFSTLKAPVYSSIEMLRDRLMFAIREGVSIENH